MIENVSGSVEETGDIGKLEIDELIVLSCKLWAIDRNCGGIC